MNECQVWPGAAGSEAFLEVGGNLARDRDVGMGCFCLGDAKEGTVWETAGCMHCLKGAAASQFSLSPSESVVLENPGFSLGLVS